MFKKRAVKGSVRKREVDTGDDGNDEVASAPAVPHKSNGIVHKSLAKLESPALRRRRESDGDDDDRDDDGATRHKRIKGVPGSIEATAVVDYQPDVCKDFWLTGYCGYGDTCKFLHIRDELRQTAPVTKDWEVDNNKKVDQEKERDLSVCAICQHKYTAPVMAECRHIFCKRCFRLRFANDKTCVVCGQESAGIVKPVSAATLALLIEKSSSDNC